MKRLAFLLLTCALVVACASNTTERDMQFLASALTKVSAAVDATVRYDEPAAALVEDALLQAATAHDETLLQPFRDMTLRVLREGADSAVLVCESAAGKALLEDAGCTARLDAQRWQGGDDACAFTLRLQELCGTPKTQ